MDEILSVKGVSKVFSVGSGIFGSSTKKVNALSRISFGLRKNSCLGIAGESGSGKSTIARIIMRILKQDTGDISFEGRDIDSIDRKEYARLVQMVFQDPYNSLNPKLSVGELITEALKVSNRELGLGKKALTEKAKVMLHTVGLATNILNDYPHQFSGGQKQRIALARALSLNPRVLIADEILSALDVSIQSQMLNLLFDLKEKFEISYIFITHDIAVMSAISDSVIILKDGKIVEEGNTSDVLDKPRMEYTKNLIASLPRVPV